MSNEKDPTEVTLTLKQSEWLVFLGALRCYQHTLHNTSKQIEDDLLVDAKAIKTRIGQANALETRFWELKRVADLNGQQRTKEGR